MAGRAPVQDGMIRFHGDISIGYVPQIPEGFEGLSGAERFQKALSEALSLQPELLILDEPSNHLDRNNRKQLLQFLRYYPGSLMIASHDSELLSSVPDSLWSVSKGNMECFEG